RVHRAGEWPLQDGHKHRSALLLCSGQRRSQFEECLRLPAGGKMIGVVLRIVFLMQGRNRVGYEVYVYNVQLVIAPKWKHRQTGQKNEGLDHVELRSLRATAV